jgi:hypothetical protein
MTIAIASVCGLDGSYQASSRAANERSSTAAGQRPSLRGYSNGACQPGTSAPAKSAAAFHGFSAGQTFPNRTTSSGIPSQKTT